MREVIKSIIIVSLIVILGISSTYAYMYFDTKKNNASSGEGGCFIVSYSGTAINSTDLVSTSDYHNGAHSVISLSKDSSCKIYTQASIYLNIGNGSTIPFNGSFDYVNAFRYKILNNGNEITSGVVRKNGDNDILLGTVSLGNTVKNYDIYLWIDSTLSNGHYDEEVFSGNLYAESVQTSTIQ